jgi:hydrogenase maturation protein HypF
MAAAFLRAAYGDDMAHLGIEFVRRLDRSAWTRLSAAVERGLNAPLTSSAGRLFDAVASLLGVRDRVEFEAQAAMELEALAAPEIDAEADRLYGAPIVDDGETFAIRTTGVIRGIAGDLLAGVDHGQIAARFHASLARVVVDGCRRVRARTGIAAVALSGGVFQNRRLARAAVAGLEGAGFEVYTHRQAPPNDGGLSLGQAAVAAARLDAAGRV